ncbi:hypothetical protein P9112_000149 [Eukaryota sp. TZLM1-RC]
MRRKKQRNFTPSAPSLDEIASSEQEVDISELVNEFKESGIDETLIRDLYETLGTNKELVRAEIRANLEYQKEQEQKTAEIPFQEETIETIETIETTETTETNTTPPEDIFLEKSKQTQTRTIQTNELSTQTIEPMDETDILNSVNDSDILEIEEPLKLLTVRTQITSLLHELPSMSICSTLLHDVLKQINQKLDKMVRATVSLCSDVDVNEVVPFLQHKRNPRAELLVLDYSKTDSRNSLLKAIKSRFKYHEHCLSKKIYVLV